MNIFYAHPSPIPPSPNRARGQVLILYVGALLLLLLVSGAVVDMAWMWVSGQRIQHAADAAALAGAPYLPNDPTSGVHVALGEATQNGYTSGTKGATVTAWQDAPGSLQMDSSITAPVGTFFLRVIGINSFTLTRTSKGIYQPPIALGSPIDYYGIDQLRTESGASNPVSDAVGGSAKLASQGFWGATITLGGSHENGDAFGPSWDYKTGKANPDFTGNGYDYAVDFPLGTTNGRLWMFDPNFCAVGNSSTTGDRLGVADHWIGSTPNAVSEYVRIYNTNGTPLDPSDDTLVKDLGNTFAGQGGIDRSVAYSGDQIYGDNAGNENAQWVARSGGGSTTLSGAVSAGRTTINVNSSTNFAVHDVVMIEGYGNNNAPWVPSIREFLAIKTVSSSHGVVQLTFDTPLVFAHASGTEIYEVYGATSSSSVNAGSTSINVLSINGLVRNDWIIFEPQNDARREMRQITSISGNRIYLSSGLTYAHAANTPLVADRSPLAGYPDCSSLSGHNGWVSLTTGLKAGNYRINVTTNNASNTNVNAEDNWGLEADSGLTTSAHVYGINDIASYTNLPAGTQSLYLAQISAVNAGKIMEINLFDPGDVSGGASLQILSPDGDAYNPALMSWTADALCASNCTGSGTTIVANANGRSNFNDSWIKITIQLPPTYGQNGLTPLHEPAAGWWKIAYTVAGGNDTTTWNVLVHGNPVHLTP